MALENGDYHVKPCEPAVSARRRASGLRFASANSSAAAELLLRSRSLRADRCSLHRGRWRGCHLPSGTASICYACLKQLAANSTGVYRARATALRCPDSGLVTLSGFNRFGMKLRLSRRPLKQTRGMGHALFASTENLSAIRFKKTTRAWPSVTDHCPIPI